MGQKRISKKELKCIDNHLVYCIKAIMRDSHTVGDLVPVEKYDSDSKELFVLLCKAFHLVDKMYEEK